MSKLSQNNLILLLKGLKESFGSLAFKNKISLDDIDDSISLKCDLYLSEDGVLSMGAIQKSSTTNEA